MSWAAFICSPPEGMDAAAVAAAIRTRFTEDEVDGHESSLKSLCEWLEMAALGRACNAFDKDAADIWLEKDSTGNLNGLGIVGYHNL